MGALGRDAMEERDTIQQFLEGRPEAAQWREWRETLAGRLEALERERARATGPAAVALDARLKQLRKQVSALREEEAVTQFVEDSVRVTLAMGRVTEFADDEVAV